MRLSILVPVLAGCAAPSATPPTPDSGAHMRLVLDDVALPTSAGDAAAAARDFNGDGILDNVIGDVIASLMSVGDSLDDAGVRDLIGAGRVPSVLDVFGSGELVGLAYLDTPSESTSVLRATADGAGGFATHDVEAVSLAVLVPVLPGADPIPMQLDYAALALSPAAAGGFDVTLQGLVEPEPLFAAACTGMFQMIAADPGAYAELFKVLDTDHDGMISSGECSAYVHGLLAPDVIGPDHANYTSLGIAMHVLTPPSVPPAVPR